MIVANLMFSLPAIDLSTTTRSAGALWLAAISIWGIYQFVPARCGIARHGAFCPRREPFRLLARSALCFACSRRANTWRSWQSAGRTFSLASAGTLVRAGRRYGVG